jgi:hypothetical protein
VKFNRTPNISEEEQPTCPKCGQPVQFGDGDTRPPLYCDNCGLGWDSLDELEYHRSSLNDFDEADLDADADLDAAEQWMWEHGGPQYQESPDPDEFDELS